MLRYVVLACMLLGSTSLRSVAGEPQLAIVVVPDLEVAAEVAVRLPGLRMSVLQYHADESDEVINARALALRHATHLLFDHASEPLRLAMFRERLQMQGVVAISIRPASLTRHKRLAPASYPQLEQLANLLNPSSPNEE